MSANCKDLLCQTPLVQRKRQCLRQKARLPQQCSRSAKHKEERGFNRRSGHLQRCHLQPLGNFSARWPCLPARHLFTHLTWFLLMLLFFAPAFLLAPIRLPQRNSRESARISWDASAERYGQPQCLSLTEHSIQLFRKQESIGQKGRKEQRNKKQK